MQEYVETTKKAITSAVKKVVRKSSDVYGVAKLSFKISSLKNDIDEKYQKIGKIAYDNYKGIDTSEEAVGELLAEIDKINSEIQELSEQLAVAKNVSVCPSCGAETSKDSTFCASCGEKI